MPPEDGLTTLDGGQPLIEEDLRNENNIKNKDDLKNVDKLYKEDCIKPELIKP